MRKPRVDLTYQHIGMLTVLEYKGRRGHDSIWLCQCECGNLKEFTLRALQRRQNPSCGCTDLPRRRIAPTVVYEGCTLNPDGTKKKLYYKWDQMFHRCYDPKDDRYATYGASGITVCDDWHIFRNFEEWAHSSGYSDDLSIERRDVTKGYSPENCLWIPMEEQARNRHSTLRIWYGGEQYLVSDIAERTGIKSATIYKWVQRGTLYENLLELRRDGRF